MIKVLRKKENLIIISKPATGMYSIVGGYLAIPRC